MIEWVWYKFVGWLLLKLYWPKLFNLSMDYTGKYRLARTAYYCKRHNIEPHYLHTVGK